MEMHDGVDLVAAVGTPVYAAGDGIVLGAEAKGTIAIHRFRALKAAEESFWLSTGQSAAAPEIRLPLQTITVSSGFGMRADPFDQPIRGAPLRAARPAGGPPPKIAPSPLTNPANVPTPMGLKMGLATPGSAAYRGFTMRGPIMMMHQGVDLAADLGTPIRAAGDGVIRGAELKGGYGNWIEIEHDDLVEGARRTKLATVYGHLSAFADGIAPGVRVKQGELIGFVGSTGRSTGPHLHFEILQNGNPTNPMASQVLRPEQLKGGELERFRKVIARDLRERQKEAGSI